MEDIEKTEGVSAPEEAGETTDDTADSEAVKSE